MNYSDIFSGENHSRKDSYCPICGGKHAFTTDDFGGS